jgi:predicted ATPase
MKISKIHIKDFHQFKDFTLDLTYPQGHEKAGQPLDKVCFIGQSGTGKTSLLDIISRFIYNLNFFNRMAATHLTDMRDYTTVEGIEITFIGNKKVESCYANNYIGVKLNGESTFIASSLNDEFLQCSPIAIFFPVNFTNNVGELKEYVESSEKMLFFYFDGITYGEIWHKINQKITEYRENQIQKSLAISEVTNKKGFKSDEILEAAKKYQEWEQNNPNPLQDLADKVLDKILNKFNLRVRTRLDFEKIEDVKTIKIETLDGQEVPYDFQSTGTRQVFLSMLPLYTLKPYKTAIFFDEPERSLYPDIQKGIVDIYTSLTTDCQLFFATHSPIIASSFDPWEIVELKFNKEGKVYRETYFEGENHIDNYKWNPKYMRWDDILQRVFDLEDDGSPDRKIKLDELATLNVKFKKLKTKGQEHTAEALDIIREIGKLSKDLSKWD